MKSDQARKTKTPVFFLMGPTASGKTDIAMHLFDSFPVELISVDSSLVYRGMDIGTAKPEKSLLAKYPHRLIDIRDPDDTYSAAEFRDEAIGHINDISQNGNIPLLVGGTMLYFKVLREGIAHLPSADDAIRAKIEEKAEKAGWPALHEELMQIDPVSAARIHPNDVQRLQRALEVFEVSGHTLTELQEQSDQGVWNGGSELPYQFHSLALMTENRAMLHRRIEDRFNGMISAGFIAEVEALRERYDHGQDLPAMRSVGYRQVWQYLSGELDHEEMLSKGKAATRQLAKRQITWLRSWADLHYFDIEDLDLLEQVSRKISVLLETHDQSPHV